MRKCISLILFFYASLISNAQLPLHTLTGYWHNWNDANAPHIPLDQVDIRYNIIAVSFAVPQTGTDYKMEFIPDQVSVPTFITQIQTLQNQNRKVFISIGGATAPVELDNITERDTFIATMGSILDQYNFDGIDIDLEGASLSLTGGTIASPTDAKIIHLIDAVKQIMSNYWMSHGKKLLLSMAPETAFVQGGMSAYGGIWGAYLPVIDALRDSLDVLQVQLYNSGSMYGIDGGVYTQGTADFIVAMTEAVIQGFNTGGGFFTGLPANKISVALPACSNAAGGGFTDTAIVHSALNYILGIGAQPGNYTLLQSSGYNDLRGMMTWSVNWDAVNSCGGSYEYADNYENIFGNTTGVEDLSFEKIKVYPNPSSHFILIEAMEMNVSADVVVIKNVLGEIISNEKLDMNGKLLLNIDQYPSGMYVIHIGHYKSAFIKSLSH